MRKHSDSKNRDANKRRPTQQRSKQIIAAVVSACRQILREEGPEALNTNHIAEVAGVNIASLYRWFENKESVLEAVFEELVKEEIDSLMQLFAQQDNLSNMSLDMAIDLLIDPIIQRHLRFISLHQYFYQQHQQTFDVGRRLFLDGNATWIEAASDWFSEVLQRHQSIHQQTDHQLASFILTRAIYGACNAAVLDNPALLSSDDFRDQLLHLTHRYLGLQTTDPGRLHP